MRASSSASAPRGRVPAIGRVDDRRPLDRQQRLGARAGDLEVAEVQVVHVRARVHRAQPAVDRERVDAEFGRPALGRDHLEDVAGVDVLDDPLDHGLELLARHVGLEVAARSASSRLAEVGHRAGEQPPRLLDRRQRVGVAALDAVLRRTTFTMIVSVCRRWSKTTRMSLSMSARSGSPSASGFGLAERLDGAHEVVAEEADRAARERRHVGQRRLRVALDLRLGDRVRIAAVAQRPAQHLARAHADERVAAHALALLGRFEQERRASPASRPRSLRNAETGVSVSAMNV